MKQYLRTSDSKAKDISISAKNVKKVGLSQTLKPNNDMKLLDDFSQELFGICCRAFS